MRFNHFIQNQWFNQILILIFGSSGITYSSINVSQSDPLISLGNHSHITTNDKPQHYYFCGEPPNVSNTVSNLMRNQKHNVFKVGEIAIYSCDIGFVKISGKEETQCMPSDGSAGPRWQQIDLICKTVKCEDPGAIDNGIVKTMSDLRYNTNVQYECNSEYRMIGVPFLTCKENGKWNRQKPKCQRKQCPEIPNPPNGRIIYGDSERRTHSKMEYTCNIGFKLSVENVLAIRYCREDHSWNLSPGMNYSTIECSLVYCEKLIGPNLIILRIIPPRQKGVSSFKPGDVIVFSCDTNSNIKASSKCLADGQWSRGPLHCHENPTTCPPIGDFEHGFYNITNSANKFLIQLKDLKINTILGFYCNQNYILNGSQSLSCLSSGVWNETVPKCTVTASLREVQSSKMRILITLSPILVVTVLVISCVLLCRWRQQHLQRRPWQQCSGHYNHRQSKINMLNRNEMKCLRQ